MAATNLKKNKLFVFAVPHVLEFNLEDSGNEAKSFSLMNCYEFPVKFKIMWQTTNKYFITPKECIMQPTKMGQCFVKFIPEAHSDYNANDDIVILMYDCSTNKCLGKGSVQIRLFRDKSSSTSSHDTNTAPGSKISKPLALPSSNANPAAPVRGQHPLRLLIILVMTTLLYYLPVTEENVDTLIPSFLHVPSAYKVFFGYIVGLLTCYLLMQE